MQQKITRRSITAMEAPATGQAWMYDTELHGFMVLCQASGRKTYVVRYKSPGGAWKKTTLGNCTELHPDEAREMARDVLAAARRGDDPTRSRKAPTVAQLAERFMDEHAGRLKPGTRTNYRILWDKHILPRTSLFVLPGTTGGPIGGIQKIWRRIRTAAGIQELRLHDLRHTVGSLGHRAGLTQRQIADLLGHRQMATTARYINSADEHKAETAAKWGQVVRLSVKPKVAAA